MVFCAFYAVVELGIFLTPDLLLPELSAPKFNVTLLTVADAFIEVLAVTGLYARLPLLPAVAMFPDESFGL